MAYNHGREERKWRIWKENEEKILRECGVDERTIEEIRIYDRAEFHSNRRFYRCTFHALRHSTASLLAAQGWHPKEIQEWLRHADFYTTMNIYTHLNPEGLVERSERLAGILNNRMA